MSLRDAYNSCVGIPNFTLEEFETVEHVDKQRNDFRPERVPVRVVLLAESHCFTSNEEAGIDVNLYGYAGAFPQQQFRRFVYCLGYGERRLLSRETPLRNSGTPQYWKIFYAATQPRPWSFEKVLVSRTPDLGNRLKNKMKVLNALKDAGVWLLDASPLAIAGAGPNMGRPPPQAISKVLKNCWKHFTRDIIVNANPKTVIVIGKGVSNALGENLQASLPGTKICSIPQPQARGSYGDHFSIIHDHCFLPT
jgi:hypothetical protein